MEGGGEVGRMLAVVVRLAPKVIGGGRFECSYIDSSRAEHPIAKIPCHLAVKDALAPLEKLLQSARDAGVADVIIDMSRVKYVDAPGLGVLVSLFTYVKRGGGRMVLADVSDRVDQVLDATQLKLVLPVFGSITEALDFFARCDAGEATWPPPPAMAVDTPTERNPVPSPPPRTAVPARAIAPVLARALAYATVFGGLVFLFIPLRLLAGAGLSRPTTAGMELVAGELMVIAGAALGLWCVHAFVVAGRGTPAPFDPPRRLVTSGPYELVRNPMYIAAVLILAGVALACRSRPVAVYAGAFAVLAHLFVVRYEEPKLRALFGEDYGAYCARVKRWHLA